MLVGQLKLILENINDDAVVMIEYSPAQDEYITEYTSGVRIADDEIVTILGISDTYEAAAP